MKYWSQWFKRWLACALGCLLICAGCGALLVIQLSRGEQQTVPAYVVNQARVEVIEIMFLLEKNHTALEAGTPHQIREQLLQLSREKKLNWVYSGLDGAVWFDSSSPAQPTNRKLQLKNDLHYDLYSAKTGPGSFTLAFPVIDPTSGKQTGNALFTLPESAVAYEPPSSFPATAAVLMSVSLCLLLLLLLTLRKKIKHDLLEGINGLKDHSEAILKGNYEQRVEYGKPDEVGEVYAVFDQMRNEIMELSLQREAQDKAKKELISNISHDLKTPLTAIKAYIEAIQAGVCTDLPAVMEYMDIIQAQANKMAGLVEDLLVHALRDLGQISVTPVECYSREVFSGILKPMGPYIRTAGVNFIEPPEIPNVLIRVDPVRMEQLLSNLIANALKHTKAGDTIQIAIVRQQDRLLITVSDTGEGILPQDMPFIFERYFQGSAPSRYEKRFKEGSGLGLSICKHIIEAHHGSISFKSVKAQGTEFYLSLPLC